MTAFNACQDKVAQNCDDIEDLKQQIEDLKQCVETKKIKLISPTDPSCFYEISFPDISDNIPDYSVVFKDKDNNIKFAITQ